VCVCVCVENSGAPNSPTQPWLPLSVGTCMVAVCELVMHLPGAQAQWPVVWVGEGGVGVCVCVEN